MTSRAPIPSHRRSAAAALLLAALLGTAACTGSQPPPPQTSEQRAEAATTSAPATPSASASPTPSYKPADASGRAQNVPVPVLPEVAKSETKEGLEAFAKYWFEVLSYGYETGDVTRLNALTSTGCELCANVSTSVATNYQSERWLAGGRIVVPSISADPKLGGDGNYQVVVQVQQAAITYYKPDGSQFRAATPPSDTGNVMLATYRDAAWRVSGLHPIR